MTQIPPAARIADGCRTAPARALTAGVNTRDPKFGIVFLPGRELAASPARDSREYLRALRLLVR